MNFPSATDQVKLNLSVTMHTVLHACHTVVPSSCYPHYIPSLCLFYMSVCVTPVERRRQKTGDCPKKSGYYQL